MGQKQSILSTSQDYSDFLSDNRSKVNKYLNRALWFTLAVGPVIATCKLFEIMDSIKFWECLAMTLIPIVCLLVSMIVRKKKPASKFVSVLLLLSLESVIYFSAGDSYAVGVTFAIVPVICSLYLDKFLYAAFCLLNYVVMALALYDVFLYKSVMGKVNINYETVTTFLIYTVETVVVILVGEFLYLIMTRHYRKLHDDLGTMSQNGKSLKEQLAVLNSLSDVYGKVILLDFTQNMFTQIANTNVRGETTVLVRNKGMDDLFDDIRNTIEHEYIEKFKNFTDLSTIIDRLTETKVISEEFVTTNQGWIRLQFIAIKKADIEIPNKIIYTIQNIDKEKTKEESLIRISKVDELTKLYNRRCYNEDIDELLKAGLGEDFVIVSADVNSLKRVNDSQGHSAGDELIKGAAKCMNIVFGNLGKVYRISGDEFMAIIHTDRDFADLKRRLVNETESFEGEIVKSLSISIGYAALKDHPDATVTQLEKLADESMYEDKAEFYRTHNIDRRR